MGIKDYNVRETERVFAGDEEIGLDGMKRKRSRRRTKKHIQRFR